MSTREESTKGEGMLRKGQVVNTSSTISFVMRAPNDGDGKYEHDDNNENESSERADELANDLRARPAATVTSTGDETHTLEARLANRSGTRAFRDAIPPHIDPGEESQASKGGHVFRLRYPPLPPATSLMCKDRTAAPPTLVSLVQRPAIIERDQQLQACPDEVTYWCQRAMCAAILVFLVAYGCVLLMLHLKKS